MMIVYFIRSYHNNRESKKEILAESSAAEKKKSLYTLEDVKKVREEKEKISLKINSFRGCWIDLQDLKNKLRYLRGKETMILRRLSKEEVERGIAEGVVTEVKPQTINFNFKPTFYNFDCGTKEFWAVFNSIKESEVWTTFKKEIEEGKYDSFFKNNKSYYSHLGKLIILFNINLKDPCSKRILEVLVAHIFYYINKRKVEGFDVKISSLFDMTLFFSDNYTNCKLYRDILIFLVQFKRLSKKYLCKCFKFDFLGLRFFEKTFKFYHSWFVAFLGKKGDLFELHNIFFLWFIFINLALLREYFFSNKKNLILLKTTTFLNRRIVFNFFLIILNNIRYFSFFFYSDKSHFNKESKGSFELRIILSFHFKLFSYLVSNRKFSPVTLRVPGGKDGLHVLVRRTYKDFVGGNDFVFFGKKGFFTKCFKDFRLGIFFKSGNTGKDSINSEYLFKDSFFYRYRNFYRGDLVYLFFPYLFYDSSYNSTRFGANFFYPGDKFLKKVKPFIKDLFSNKGRR